MLSNDPRDKLQAVLNCEWQNPDHTLPSEYRKACGNWFNKLTDRQRKVASIAGAAFRKGHEGDAERIAAPLPAAPRFPLLSGLDNIRVVVLRRIDACADSVGGYPAGDVRLQ